MSAATSTTFATLPARIFAAAVVASVGLTVGFEFAGGSTKRQVIILAAMGVMVVAAATRKFVPLLLLGWLMAMTYNRQYYSFDGIYGDYGSAGLYWVPADAMFVLLAATWTLKRIHEEKPIFAVTPATMCFVPFIIGGAISALFGNEVMASLAELIRWCKVALITVILVELLRGANWWWCIGAFAVAMLFQCTLGIMQFGLNTNTGLLSMFGGSATGNTIGQSFSGSTRTRASGTMVHPNIFAPYLLFLVPAAISLVLCARDIRVRGIAAIVAAAGLCGLVASMSRLPIVITAGQVALLCIILVGIRRLSVKVPIALASAAIVVMTIAASFYAEQIYERLTGDFSQSLTFRAEYNDAAIGMWLEHPITGIGLNGFSDELGRFEPMLATILEDMKSGRTEFGLRAVAPVHNLYLLVLSETGAIGILGFLFLLGSGLVLGIRAINRTTGAQQLVCIGLFVGLVGQCLQQLMDFSLWMDPGLLTFSVSLCLLYTATLNDAQSEPFPEPSVEGSPS